MKHACDVAKDEADLESVGCRMSCLVSKHHKTQAAFVPGNASYEVFLC